MVNFPLQLNDPLEQANSLLDTGFSSPVPPTANGFANRQSSLANERIGVQVRNLIRFLVPESGIVEMYVNPQNITYNYKKLINKQRTKGGYVLQYWGEDLTQLRISGTTGTSGVEGINVLYDVYRAEQLAYDPYALSLAAQQQVQAESLQSTTAQVLNTFGDLLQISQESGISNVSGPKPTLASYAFGVEMYYSGEVYRGYFESFTVTESADKLGLFDYVIEYVVTQKRGFRSNFLGWQKSAVSGPSDSSINGPPHSYHGLANGFNAPNSGNSNQNNSNVASGINKNFNSIVKL